MMDVEDLKLFYNLLGYFNVFNYGSFLVVEYVCIILECHPEQDFSPRIGRIKIKINKPSSIF